MLASNPSTSPSSTNTESHGTFLQFVTALAVVWPLPVAKWPLSAALRVGATFAPCPASTSQRGTIEDKIMNRLIACMLVLSSAGACASDESTRSHSTTVRANDETTRHRHRERVVEHSVDQDVDADHRGRDREVIRDREVVREREVISSEPSAV